ncbi:hypothetical protein K443DRAFT_582423 [Laccaria amethystina LaAM-08-1]|uniref:UPF3 domain-containing protein n=1 Tax=Laccaria amethystina LaAM-08-1 TaxID=1095629 RepID=A0A0C9XTE0_9AGAR|nr:hypothetical protein K443DRAFT_582423 [Laccaria amethystina LaAM-08-1]
MSTSPSRPKAPPTKPKKERERERERERKEKALQQSTERLKTVVRRLPPNLPEEVFWQSVQPWVTEEAVSWKVFYAGKARKRLSKENIPSRAYIAFKSEEKLAQFSREYDGHLFRDKAGNESYAIVEFAPYQKVPTEKRKPDVRNATIEKDEDYISFLESLNASANAEPPSLEALIASAQQPPPPKTTPLLEALKAEKSANKDKEAILRNHAHYKDQLPGAVARKDDKKKVPPAVQAQKVAEAAAVNKKAAGKKPQVAPTAAAVQNQKPGPAGLPKSVGNVPGPSNLGVKPPKPARAPRAPPAKPQNVVPTAIQQQPPGPSATPIPTSTQQQSPDGAATPTPRRARPVIGLASRQFEAALSGVGGGKSRREREREREKEREEGAVTPIAAVSPSLTSAPGLAQTPSIASTPAVNVKEAGKPAPPTSPRKGRRGSHGRGGGSGGGGVGRPPSAASAVNDTKVPGIIQRADGAGAGANAPLIIQKDVPVVGSPVVNIPMGGGRGGGGGPRRGRGGGGRGRGGAPRGG